MTGAGDSENRQGAGREPKGESLPSLLGRVGEDLTALFDAKLGLLKIEIREGIGAYARAVAIISVGGLIAVVGFTLVNVAVAFIVSGLFEEMPVSRPVRYALGFIITGAAYLVVGGAIILMNKNRLARHVGPAKSIEELKKDREWLKKDI